MTDQAPKRILVIEDDLHIAEGLRLNLALQGYQVMLAAGGAEGLRAWKEFQPDLIVLDIMLPGIDGYAVLENIRLTDERLPILILSAKAASDDKIRGLSLGVDDYLTKPFQLEEFMLRVQRLLKRMEWSNGPEASHPADRADASDVYSFGPNRIDFGAHTARTRSGAIRLTEQETRLLKLFVSHRGQLLSRRRLMEVGWGYARGLQSRTVDNFMVRLRKYFEEDPKHPLYFKSVRAVGYIFDHPDKRQRPERADGA